MLTAFRAATIQDSDALAQLRWDMLVEFGVDMPPRDAWNRNFALWLVHFLMRPDCAAMVAEEADGAITAMGFVMILPRVPAAVLPPVWYSGRAYINAMYTVPHARGLGHGRKILAALSQWAEDKGVEDIELHTSEQAKPLYKRAGFRTIPHAMALKLRQ